MKVVCFGDSNTYGYDPRSYLGGRYDEGSRWPDILARECGWKLCNWGENGRTIPLDFPQLPLDADLFIVMLGTNDLLQGMSPQAVSTKMEHFVSGLKLERDKILLISPPPMSRGTWVPDESLISASLLLESLYRSIAGRFGIRFAGTAAWNIELAYDGVHFTRQGHCEFALKLLKEIKIWENR